MVDVCRYYQVFIKFVLGHLQTRRHILFILSCVSHDVEISCVFFLFSFAPSGVIIFLLKKTTLCQLVEWYVARTNQIAALGYVSRTNYITAFGYLAPITAFGCCILVNYVMESGGRAQRMILTRNFEFI